VRREGRRGQPSKEEVAAGPLAILFGVGGTLISTGGAGTRNWPLGVGEPPWDPRRQRGVFGSEHDRSCRRPKHLPQRHRTGADRAGIARLLTTHLEWLPEEAETSEHYRVLPGAEALLGRLCQAGCLVGIVTGALEAAAHIKLTRAASIGSSHSAGMGPIPTTAPSSHAGPCPSGCRAPARQPPDRM
jgi:phosphoglycolate phosphatase